MNLRIELKSPRLPSERFARCARQLPEGLPEQQATAFVFLMELLSLLTDGAEPRLLNASYSVGVFMHWESWEMECGGIRIVRKKEACGGLNITLLGIPDARSQSIDALGRELFERCSLSRTGPAAPPHSR